jgi:hypothetical protein
MNSIRRSLILLFLSHLIGGVFADTLILKDGTKIRGEILEEGPSGITIECRVTPTIKDQKIVAKSDIEKVEKVSQDQKDFQELGSLDTPPTVTDTSFYDPLIDRKLPEFISKYPDSSLNSEACERLKALTQERERVQRGDRRLESVWITASEIAAEPYQSGALVKFTCIKMVAASNNAVEALKGYELLEKSYPGSAVMPDAVPIALQQLQQLQSQVAVAKANVEIELKNISNSVVALEKTRADEARKLKDAMLQYENNAKSAMTVAGADGSKFFPVFQKSKDSLAALQVLILSERARLSQFPLSTMREGIASAKEGLRMIKAEKIKEARDQLALSQRLWPANYDNTKLKLLADRLEADIAAKASEAAKQTAAEGAVANARKLAAEKVAKEAAAKAADKASQEAADKVAKEAAQKAALDAAKEAAGLATPTPSPSQKDVADKLKDRSQILDVLEK